ncbi:MULTISPECIES: FecR family protein [Brucella/Ochrobactrum group]|uniref:Anti-FecI sigma factor, FecR n=1 Tax=Brucella anthropi (strain ATCC 49188 / DSM 6882 / CCUG 24695 / JCM 21032 / LMG 3331 / NBRC 15819 / NCTC 12168 / Alc 37) TaxID=439375 RepID=A6X2N0_BRUA4|nr:MULTISPECIES: FecR family protein [Brucella/Ochrobactrum group]ABS15484.1 anti-FecI sigma factor, FecR [Brucella anthropi ATCC 49188]AIK41613.1 fecR family protein [Brucella anthropi]KAB2729918.1 FecR family protein [Brucella anthropi]KAB2746624.1 FecR family protein [Brucella anthropi]KAB2749252.1 FecR family protein [Brucella anthropi]
MKEFETDPVYMKALEWFVLLQDKTVSADDRRAFSAWIASDPAHRVAYERAQTLWQRFDAVKPEYDRIRQSGHKSDGRVGRRGVVLGGLAALVLLPGAYLLSRPGLFATYQTGVGERRSFTLADGSTVELGSYSALSLDFSGNGRNLVLHEGQGFFQVASDPSRPFVVSANGGTITALGTAFDVKLIDRAVTVSVVEHAVSVAFGQSDPVRLDEGWQITYGGDEAALPQRADPQTVEAWRNDRIIFEDVPLSRVLSELERYRRGRIFLTDTEIGNMPVTAIFDTRDAEAALATIAETLPVRVLNGSGWVTVVTRR